MVTSEVRVQSADPPVTQPRGRRRALLLLRIIVPVAAIGYLLSIVPLSALLASISKTAPLAIVAVVVIISAGMAVATLRWRVVARACGIEIRTGFLELYRVYWIGAFYNSYVPGGVGGDVVRGLATRHAVGPQGLPAALAIVLLERVLGLAGLLILVATAFVFVPLRVIPHVMAWSAFGLFGAIVAVVAIACAPRLAPHLPTRLARIALLLPAIRSVPRFALALLLSIVTQLAGVVSGHLIVSSIDHHVSWGESLVVLPLINAAQFFPLTIGGAGVREAGFVVLYGMCGVEKSDALAASLVFATTLYVLNAVGGVLHALRPLADQSEQTLTD